MLECRLGIRGTDGAHRLVLDQRVVTDCLVHVALEYRAAVYGGDHAVDDLSAHRQRQHTRNHDDGCAAHQNVCPMLKKKLMRRSVPCSKICVPTGKCSSPGT